IKIDDSSVADGLLGRNGQKRSVNAIGDAAQRRFLLSNAFPEFFVDLFKSQMTPPAFSLPAGYPMDNRLLLGSAAPPLQDFDARNACQEHPPVADDSHFQILVRKVERKHAKLQRTPYTIFIFKTDGGMVVDLVLALNDAVYGTASKS